MSEAKVISFRLDAALHASLASRASADGKSVSELARELIAGALEPSPGKCAFEMDRATSKEFEALRKQLSVMFEAFFVATQILSPDQARRFIEEKFP